MVQRILLAAACLALGSVALAEMPGYGTQEAAKRVQLGGMRMHERFSACAADLRTLGLDSRFLAHIWDAEHFDLFEGVRITLASQPPAGVSGAELAAAPAGCAGLQEPELLESAGISGVEEADLQLMRQVFLATKPAPHELRDRNLYTDCMKVNFNTREVDFPTSVHLCDCTLQALHVVPDDELDDWLQLAHAGVNVPMAEQAWYGIFVDKLWACSSSL